MLSTSVWSLPLVKVKRREYASNIPVCKCSCVHTFSEVKETFGRPYHFAPILKAQQTHYPTATLQEIRILFVKVCWEHSDTKKRSLFKLKNFTQNAHEHVTEKFSLQNNLFLKSMYNTVRNVKPYKQIANKTNIILLDLFGSWKLREHENEFWVNLAKLSGTYTIGVMY